VAQLRWFNAFDQFSIVTRLCDGGRARHIRSGRLGVCWVKGRAANETSPLMR
jgi:hypothetical protein